mmetsp:Transcript_19732/g.50017  ORF Transcript_19732/g.50017 Transcript_19732/m.50017 type:complete len:279 (+) Transcript_19732:1040-1876(+)
MRSGTRSTKWMCSTGSKMNLQRSAMLQSRSLSKPKPKSTPDEDQRSIHPCLGWALLWTATQRIQRTTSPRRERHRGCSTIRMAVLVSIFPMMSVLEWGFTSSPVQVRAKQRKRTRHEPQGLRGGRRAPRTRHPSCCKSRTASGGTRFGQRRSRPAAGGHCQDPLGGRGVVRGRHWSPRRRWKAAAGNGRQIRRGHLTRREVREALIVMVVRSALPWCAPLSAMESKVTTLVWVCWPQSPKISAIQLLSGSAMIQWSRESFFFSGSKGPILTALQLRGQ